MGQPGGVMPESFPDRVTPQDALDLPTALPVKFSWPPHLNWQATGAHPLHCPIGSALDAPASVIAELDAHVPLS